MSEHEQTADTLDGAADVIERDGWHQGVYRDVSGVCAIGALGRAAGLAVHQVEEVDYRPRLALAVSLELEEPEWALSVIHWNDAPERTKQEVLDALRGAAKAERRLADGIES